jgi:hypothetical protein
MAILDRFSIKGAVPLSPAPPGIGLAYAQAMEGGAAVTLWRISTRRGRARGRTLREAGHEARAAHCDVSSSAAVAAAFDDHDRPMAASTSALPTPGSMPAQASGPAGHRNPGWPGRYLRSGALG